MRRVLETIGIGFMVVYAVVFFCVATLLGVRLEDDF